MASIENPVKDDSSSEGEDLSENAKLVGASTKKSGSGSTSSSTITADGPLQCSPKTPNSKPANNGIVLTGAFGDSSTTLRGVEDMDDPLEDSETAKLLGSTSKEKLTGGGKVGKSSSAKEVVVKEVKETQRKLIKVAKNGEKTEIIIERSETVHENITNVERSAIPPPKDIMERGNVADKTEPNRENKDETGDGDKKAEEVEEKKKSSDFENEKDVEDVKKDEILIITDATDRGPKDVPEADEGGSEVSPSDAATDSCEQDTDTYDLYQTVGSMTPNSLSNADVFRSLAATVASSQATFISAEDTLGPREEVPASPRSLHGTDIESAPLESVELESRNVEPGQSTPGGLGTEDGEEEDGKETRQASQDHTEDEDTMREITFEDGAVLAPAVMYPAQVHQYCPPGLEGLLDIGQLVIHRQNLRHNVVFNNDALNRMEVIDISRKVLFYVEEEAPPLSQQSFLFKVYNRNKQEVMQIYNPQSTTCIGCGASWHCFRKCNFQTLVFAPLGQVAGFVKRSHTYFVQEYLVLNSQEDVMLVMRGGPDDLEIYTPDLENELGRLAVHHWHGIMHEVRRSNVDYGITFPIDLDVRVKAVLLGAVFALDWMYTTKGGRLR